MRTTKEAHFNIQGYAQMQRNVISSVQLLSRVRLFVTPWSAAHQASLPITNSWSIQTHVHRVDDAIQPSHPLSSPSPSAFNLSQHQGLCQWVSSSHQVAKVLEFQLQHQSSNEYSGLVSFRIDWFDLLAVQRTLKSFLQHYSSKASILQCSDFFTVQLSQSIHDYWKNHSFDYIDLCQQRWLQSMGVVKSWRWLSN